MMKLLVVSYYFPPMGLSGVLRPVKFIKYLVRLGWDVEVLTCSPRSYYAFDESLMEEIPPGVRVIRTASLDIHHLACSGSQKGCGRKDGSSKLPAAAGRNLSRFLLFPDSKIGWYPFAVSKYYRQVKGGKPDVVLATGPPWTSFLIGRAVAQRFGVPLVLDYRDSWLMDPQSPQPTGFHRWAAERLESRVMRRCSTVVTVNETVREEILSRYPWMAGKVTAIFNGYDPEDLERSGETDSVFLLPPGDCLRLFYMGTLYQDVNRPERLFEALQILKDKYRSSPPLEAVFMGITDARYPALAQKMGIGDLVRFVPYRRHREALVSLEAADAALLLVDPHPHADRHVPGKLYEYLGVRIPVLALAPAGTEAGKIIEENGAGVVLPPDEPAAIARALGEWIELKLAGKPLPSIADSSLSPFDRKQQTKALDRILRALL